MTSPKPAAAGQVKLLWFRIGPVRCAAPALQVSGVMDLADGQVYKDLFWLHELLGFPEPVTYGLPTVLTVTSPRGPQQVVVDALTDIGEIDLTAVRPLPRHLSAGARQRGLIGILPESMCLVIDFGLLLSGSVAADH